MNSKPNNNFYVSVTGNLTDKIHCDTERFKTFFDVKCLNKLIFSNWKVEQLILSLISSKNNKKQISPSSTWLGSLYKQNISNPDYSNVTICWINEKIGYGLFTNKQFEAFEFVAEYTGIIRFRNLSLFNGNNYSFKYPYFNFKFKKLIIDSENQGNISRFINHSDEPNTEAICVFHEKLFHIIIRTTKTIPINTQLTIDYGDTYWKNRLDKISSDG